MFDLTENSLSWSNRERARIADSSALSHPRDTGRGPSNGWMTDSVSEAEQARDI